MEERYGLLIISLWRNKCGTSCSDRRAGYGLKASMHFAMQPDPVDYGEWKSGVNTAGTLSAVNGFVGKVGMAIASSIGAALLQFGGFDANQAIQTVTAQHYITAMYIWVPILINN